MLRIESKNGKTYYCDPEDRYYIERLREGQYQLTNWRYIKDLIVRRRNAIDVGSNNACNAVHYSDYFQQVYCFEPFPYNQQLWQKTIQSNLISNCVLYPYALGSYQHHAEFLTHPKNQGHNYVYYPECMTFKNGIWQKTKNRARNARVQIEIHTLDQYCFDQIDFIKIDVEGFEMSVLLGAEFTIKQERPVIQLELVSKQCRHYGYHPEDLVNLLRTWGYGMFSKYQGMIDSTFRSDAKYLYHREQRIKQEMDFFFIHESQYKNWPAYKLVADA